MYIHIHIYIYIFTPPPLYFALTPIPKGVSTHVYFCLGALDMGSGPPQEILPAPPLPPPPTFKR